jgi:hypothetical protein
MRQAVDKHCCYLLAWRIYDLWDDLIFQHFFNKLTGGFVF